MVRFSTKCPRTINIKPSIIVNTSQPKDELLIPLLAFAYPLFLLHEVIRMVKKYSKVLDEMENPFTFEVCQKHVTIKNQILQHAGIYF